MGGSQSNMTVVLTRRDQDIDKCGKTWKDKEEKVATCKPKKEALRTYPC